MNNQAVNVWASRQFVTVISENDPVVAVYALVLPFARLFTDTERHITTKPFNNILPILNGK
jgi:hypothetical protein